MKLYVVRHGQTEWNAINRVLGRTDMPLNEEGLRQAEELSEKVRDLPVDVILASPLKRTLQTAEAVARVKNLPVVPEQALIECDFGIYEGVPRDDPDYHKARREYFKRYPRGESFMDIAGRVYPLLHRILDQYPGKNVMLVTHGGVGRIVENYFYDMEPEEFTGFAMKNCELREYEW